MKKLTLDMIISVPVMYFVTIPMIIVLLDIAL